jgi:hypothetical protein
MPITYPTDSAGNPTISINPPTGTGCVQVQGTTATGSVAIGNAVINGVNADGGNGGAASIQLMAADAAKQLKVNNEGGKATYVSAFQVTPAASATDIVQLIGSATKIVKVTRVSIAGIASSAAVIDVIGVKRSAADTGGTGSSTTITNHDSGDGVATAVCTAYTANPSVGATGSKYGNARFGKVGLQTAAGTVTPIPLIWTFGMNNDKALTLRAGISDAFCINLNGVQSSGQVMDIEITWTEE